MTPEDRLELKIRGESYRLGGSQHEDAIQCIMKAVKTELEEYKEEIERLKKKSKEYFVSSVHMMRANHLGSHIYNLLKDAYSVSSPMTLEVHTTYNKPV